MSNPIKKRPHIQNIQSVLKSLESYPARKHRPNTLHYRVPIAPSTASKKSCIYCSMLLQVRKNKGEKVTWDKAVKRTNKKCIYCNVILCADHFDEFHLASWIKMPWITINRLQRGMWWWQTIFLLGWTFKIEWKICSVKTDKIRIILYILSMDLCICAESSRRDLSVDKKKRIIVDNHDE